jgi:hypothetical protein
MYQVVQYNRGTPAAIFSEHNDLVAAVREARKRSRKLPAGSNLVEIGVQRADGEPIDEAELQEAHDQADRPKPRHRSVSVSVWLSPAEARFLDAKRGETTRSDYLRQAALGDQVEEDGRTLRRLEREAEESAED